MANKHHLKNIILANSNKMIFNNLILRNKTIYMILAILPSMNESCENLKMLLSKLKLKS